MSIFMQAYISLRYISSMVLTLTSFHRVINLIVHKLLKAVNPLTPTRLF